MFRANVLVFGFLILVPNLVWGRILFPVSLRAFLDSLERYKSTENDVVFLLDKSQSDFLVFEFLQLKFCAKLISQRFTVSADHSRMAFVTFADTADTLVNHIQKTDRNDICSLYHEMDKIGFKLLKTHADLKGAMLEAEKILEQSRPGANKIIVLFSIAQSDSRFTAIDVANRLKQDGIIIFAIGLANVNDAEINSLATDRNHTYILDDFEDIRHVNDNLEYDARKREIDLYIENSECPGICDERAIGCICDSRTGRYKCGCPAGYYATSTVKGECHECPRGTYKSEPSYKDCTPCPRHATTDKEGSTSSVDCKCKMGFKKVNEYCHYIEECLYGFGVCEFICSVSRPYAWPYNYIITYNCKCPDNMVLSEDEKTCKDAGYCVKDGQTYMNEETWISYCQTCICDRGIVNCSGVPCNETECQPGGNECYIDSEHFQEVSVSRGSLAANSTAVLLSMCLLTLIITNIVSILLL